MRRPRQGHYPPLSSSSPLRGREKKTAPGPILEQLRIRQRIQDGGGVEPLPPPPSPPLSLTPGELILPLLGGPEERAVALKERIASSSCGR